MYQLSRLLLRLTALIGLYCLVLLAAMTWPASGLMVGTVIFIRLIRKGRRYFTTLGSARWATEKELRQAGMLDAESGLILGRKP